MSVRCAAARTADRLALRFAPNAERQPHAQTCLACQARAARIRLLERRVGGLRGELVGAPPGFVEEVMARVAVPDAPEAGHVAKPHDTARVVGAGLGVTAAIAVAVAAGRRLRRTAAA